MNFFLSGSKLTPTDVTTHLDKDNSDQDVEEQKTRARLQEGGTQADQLPDSEIKYVSLQIGNISLIWCLVLCCVKVV